jgi:hypothetical protein
MPRCLINFTADNEGWAVEMIQLFSHSGIA